MDFWQSVADALQNETQRPSPRSEFIFTLFLSVPSIIHGVGQCHWNPILWWWDGDYAAFNTRMQIQTALLQLCYGFQWNTGNRHAVM